MAMKKILGVVCYIGVVCIGFSIGTHTGIAALIICWLIEWKRVK